MLPVPSLILLRALGSAWGCPNPCASQHQQAPHHPTCAAPVSATPVVKVLTTTSLRLKVQGLGRVEPTRRRQCLPWLAPHFLGFAWGCDSPCASLCRLAPHRLTCTVQGSATLLAVVSDRCFQFASSHAPVSAWGCPSPCASLCLLAPHRLTCAELILVSFVVQDTGCCF